MRDAGTMVMNDAALELGDCDEEMTIDHNSPCEDVLRNALMNQIGGRARGDWSEKARLSLSSSEQGLDNTPPFREECWGLGGEKGSKKQAFNGKFRQRGRNFGLLLFLLGLGGCHNKNAKIVRIAI